jgi:O-antigen ligase
VPRPSRFDDDAALPDMSEAAARVHAQRTAIEPCDVPAPRRRDWLLAFGGALILTDALDGTLYGLFGWRAMLVPGLPISRLPLLAVFAAAGLLLAGDLRGAADHVRATWVLWPAVALTFISALWSQQPATTLLWAAALLGTSAFGIALAVRFSAPAQAALTAAVVTTIALGSAFVALLWPTLGVAARGQWRGLYVHKNLLGRSMALGVATALTVTLNARRRALALVALLICAGVLLKTQSRASMLAALVAVVAAMLLLAARAWRQHAAAILASGATASILVVAFLVATRPGLALIDRNETLTDRTLIWKAVVAGTMDAQWIGHGYAAFWPSASGQRASALFGVPVTHAHNGAVDLYAELGFAGLVLVLVPLGVFTAAAFRHALAPAARACLWPATYLVFFVASNAGESALLRHKLYWALYVAAACHVARRDSTRGLPAVRP